MYKKCAAWARLETASAVAVRVEYATLPLLRGHGSSDHCSPEISMSRECKSSLTMSQLELEMAHRVYRLVIGSLGWKDNYGWFQGALAC